MLMVQITNRHTLERIGIPVALLADFCKDRNWEYSEIKNVFNKRVHIYNHYFFLYNVEDEPKKKPSRKKVSTKE